MHKNWGASSHENEIKDLQHQLAIQGKDLKIKELELELERQSASTRSRNSPSPEEESDPDEDEDQFGESTDY